MTIYKLPIVLEPQPEGGYVVTSPLVPELITEGDTVEEALANAQDAISALIEAWDILPGVTPPPWVSAARSPSSFRPVWRY